MDIGTALQFTTRGIFLLLGILTLADFIRYRGQTRLDVALAFNSLAIPVSIGLVTDLTGFQSRLVSVFSTTALLAQPYLLVRVITHFQRVPKAIHIVSWVGLAYSSIVLIAVEPPVPLPITLSVVAYFVVVEGYAAAAIIRGAVISTGIARKRLVLAAVGTSLLGAIFLLAGVLALVPDASDGAQIVIQLVAIVSGVAFYLGFAPPRALRYAWQLDELYRFLREVAGGPVTGEISDLLNQLSRSASRAVGGLSAETALWDDYQETLVLQGANKDALLADDGVVRRAWAERKPSIAYHPTGLGAEGVQIARAADADVLYVVPIATLRQGWGVLLVFKHGTLFPDDDLELLALFAEQTATALENADLLSRQQALVGQLRRWQHLFEHAEWGVVVGSADGKTIEMMNPAFASMHGYTVDELSGKPLIEVFALDARAELIEHIRLAHEKGHHTFESSHIRKDGATFPVLVDVTAVKDKTGNVLYRAVNVQDITERKRTEEEIRNLNKDLERRAAELESANKELEAFSYSVSHDLRAPLRSLSGFSRILLEKYAEQLPEKAQGYLRYLSEDARQMGALIDDLLAFSRLSRQPLKKSKLHPAQIVQDVLEDLHAEQDHRHVDISIGKLPHCMADPALLKQVYVNLLSNALKYSRKRDSAQIEVGYKKEKGERIYFVKDNGVGFDMRHADKLFGVFQRLHLPEEYEGTGVGLAIVQRIVHRHGGRVWCDARPEAGATFYFTL